MRLMKWVLALAVLQLCAWGVVATLISGCMGETPTNDVVNNPPVINGLIAMPDFIGIGGSSHIIATLSDRDFDIVSWTVTVDPVSRGTCVPNRGSVDFRGGQAAGSIDCLFTATGAGRAVIRASADDGHGGVATATVEINVRAGGE